MLASLHDGDAIESEVTLTEPRMEEIIGHGHLFLRDYIFPQTQNLFTSDVEFDIEIYVSIVIARYKNSRSF